MHRLVVQRALHIVVIGDGFESQQLAQRRQALQLRQLGGRYVTLELQYLQLYLEEVAFAHISDAKPFIADVHGLLEALQVLLCEFQGRFGQQNIDKLLTNIEDQLALAIGDLRPHHRGLILRGP